MSLIPLEITSNNIVLGEGTYILPINFSYDFGTEDVSIQGIPGKTFITSYDGTSATDFSPKELDVTITDNNLDGLYVVKKHQYFEYGGGFNHLNLKSLTSYNTNGKDVFYIQGTILKKEKGIWSRHYTGYGFKTKGNIIIKDVFFDNCQFYLFSPLGLNTSDKFLINNCSFKNISRIISTMLYSGINQEPNWFTHLTCYSTNGTYRFKNFEISNCTFEKIHTSIIWAVPPSYNIVIQNNLIKSSNTLICAFNLFMKNYLNDNFYSYNAIQTISYNSFIDVLNDQCYTTSLIRTSGIANVVKNIFSNTNMQCIYLYGSTSVVSYNEIIAASGMTTAILIKSSLGVHTISYNIVSALKSIFIALEGQSSVNAIKNDIKCNIFYSRVENTNMIGSINSKENKITCQILFNSSGKGVFTFSYVSYTSNIIKAFLFNSGNVIINRCEYSKNIFPDNKMIPTINKSTISYFTYSN